MTKHELDIGDRLLGRFSLKKPIAEGGMSTVYLAIDEVTGRGVAVKVLYDYYAENEVIRTRFLEEGRLQQMLRHPNIVHVLNVVEEPVLAFVMEHVDGPTLDDYLINNGPLSERELVDIIIPVMSAVGFAHSKGVIHRDIKPSNILVEQRGGVMVPKVMDFGVAKVQSAKRDLTATGTTVGTLHYMSPEQIVGSKKIDGRADIYSIGVTIYKLMTGEVPFNAPTEFALMMAQVEAPPLPPRQLREEMSKELEDVILRAMSKKAEDRYPSIKDFTQALLQCKSTEGAGMVADTLTDQIPAQILQFAMEADEIATDRTGEMDFSTANRLLAQANGRPTQELEDQPTFEIERDRIRNELAALPEDQEATTEISPLALRRIKEEAEERNAGQIEADPYSMGETAPIPGLSERLGDAASDPEELRTTLENHSEASDTDTRPSRPSAMLRKDDAPGGSPPRNVRRSGFEVFDSKVGSRDLTAPKISEADFQSVLDSVRKSGEMIPGSRESGHVPPRKSGSSRPIGERQRVPADLPLESAKRKATPSGPKVVIGKNYADTSDRTARKITSSEVDAAKELAGLHSRNGMRSGREDRRPSQSGSPLAQDSERAPNPLPRFEDLPPPPDHGPPVRSGTGMISPPEEAPPSESIDKRMIFVLIAAVLVIVAASLWILHLLIG